jgi:hypothetical protein
LENRLNKLEVVLEELKNKVEYECLSENKNLQNIECQEQSIAIIENKKDKIIQLKDVITSFGSKYIVKLSFKDILGIRIPIKIKLTPHITYKILALVDTCTKNIIHDKYFIKCTELVHTIDDRIAETSTDMSGIRKIHNQLAYNIEAFINGTKYIIDEITIRDLSMISDDMIVGLIFLQHSVQTTFIHENGITFIPYQDIVPYISEVRKRGGTNRISNLDTNLEEVHDISANDKKDEISTSIETYYIFNTNT